MKSLVVALLLSVSTLIGTHNASANLVRFDIDGSYVDLCESCPTGTHYNFSYLFNTITNTGHGIFETMGYVIPIDGLVNYTPYSIPNAEGRGAIMSFHDQHTTLDLDVFDFTGSLPVSLDNFADMKIVSGFPGGQYVSLSSNFQASNSTIPFAYPWPDYSIQISAVPESSTWLMMIIGFAAMGIVAQRIKRRSMIAAAYGILSLALMISVGEALLSPAAAQQPLAIKPVAEKKLSQLPSGPLYWRIENFPTLGQAQAAAGPASLAAEISGKVWLFTLGPKGGDTPGGIKVSEIGPIPSIAAPEYLLRINHVSGPSGAKTSVHTHPGSEAFYVLAGRLGQRTPHGVSHADAGQAMNGHGADTPMEVFSAGTTDLDQLVMFVVDATKPFSSPAKF